MITNDGKKVYEARAKEIIEAMCETIFTTKCVSCGNTVELKQGQLNICCDINYQAGFCSKYR